MAKKLDTSFDFLGLRPGESALDVNNINNAVNRNINSNPLLYKAYHSEELFRPQLEQIQRERELERLRNVDVNSFNYLAKKAGYDEGYASNLFNRVQDLSTMETNEALSAYSQLAKELNDLKESGTTNQFGGIDYLADFREGLFELGRKAANLFGDDKTYTDPLEYLGKRKDDPNASAILDQIFTPDDIYKYAKGVLDKKHKEISLKKFSNQIGGADNILNLIESKQRNLKSQNGFDDLLMPVLDNQFTTPGSEYYRDDKGELSSQDVKEYQNYIKEGLTSNLDKSGFFNSILNKPTRYAKYDLEKEALNDYKYILQDELVNVAQERRNLIDSKQLKTNSPEDKEYQTKINRLNSALEKLVSREKQVDNIYGISVGDRSGFIKGTLGSAYMATRDLIGLITPDFNDAKADADAQIMRNAMYKPEVLKYDKYGQAVLSNQVFYETPSGNKTNWSGFFESGGVMIGDMAPTIALGAGITGLVEKGLAITAGAAEGATTTFGSRLLSSSAKAYDKANKYGGLRLSDRAATFASVAGTVYPRIYEQEKKWGGNAKDRAQLLTIAEAGAEAIGFPDVGFLKIKPFSRSLKDSAKTAAGISLSRSELTKAYLRGGAEFAKTAVKANLVESFEEEMALLGEALVSSAYSDEYDATGRERTVMDAETIVDTFVESFKGGLLYSGIMTGMNHYRATRPDPLLDQAEYEAANNPELFKAKLKEIHQKNPAELNEKELADAFITIDGLANTFKSLSQLDNLKDLNTFFDDEDSRRALFTAARRRDVLVSLDFDSLTPEQVEEFTHAKLTGKAAKNAAKQYNQVRSDLASLVELSNSRPLTDEEKKQQITLTLQAAQLRPIVNSVDTRKLKGNQLQTLASMGLIQDKDFEFTQADLDKMIADVDTEILKTEKRAFKYAEMSKAEKSEAIKKIYVEKIEAITQTEDPNLLFQSLVALKKDYEYLEKNVLGINPELLANKQALLDAYQNRFDELTKRGSDGKSLFETKLSEFNIEQAIAENNLIGLIDFSQKIDNNKDHVDADFGTMLVEQTENAYSQVLENLSKLTGEQKIAALAKVMEQTTKRDTFTYFDKNSFSKFLKITLTLQNINTKEITQKDIQVTVSDEEFEAVRTKFITDKGIQKSVSMATTGRVDNVSVPVTNSTTEDTLRTLARQASKASSQVDESGVSEKSVLEKQYFDNFLVGKTPAEMVQGLKDRVFSLLNKGSANATNLLAAFNELLTSKNVVAFDSQVNSIKSILKLEVDSLRNRDKNSKAAETLEGVIAELDLWQKTAKRMLLQNPATDFSTLVNVVPVDNSSPGQNLKDLEDDLLNDLDDDITLDQIKTKEKEIAELDQKAQMRRSRLLDLASPLKSNGIEADANDVLSTDPAVVRRVEFIEDLASTPNLKIKIMNKRQFLREFLSAKFPNKSAQEIENDLNTISAFFSSLPQTVINSADQLNGTESFFAPINDLLGINFFDLGQLQYYVKNKGQGLLIKPEVIMTAATSDGKIILKNNFPLELSFARDGADVNLGEFKNVPWKISGKLEDLADDLKIQAGDVNAAHVETYQAKQLLKAHLEQNDESVLTDFEVSEGVVPKTSRTEISLQDSTDPSLQQSGIDDFTVPTQNGSTIADKSFKFNLGRLYFNNNGTPIMLNNKKLAQSEIEAIAEIIYSSEERILPSELDTALFDLINQINKNNRIVFFQSEPVTVIGENGEMITSFPQLLVPSLVTVNPDGTKKYTKLSKEDFKAQLANYYYKASTKYLRGGTSFGRQITRFYMRNGQPIIEKQNYLDFIKETHTAPVTASGELATTVNKIVYPNPTAVLEKAKLLGLKNTGNNQPSSNANTTSKTTKSKISFSSPGPGTAPIDNFTLLSYPDYVKFTTSLGFPPISEDVYNAALLEIKRNPNALTIKSYIPDNGKLQVSDYLGAIPNVSFHLSPVNVGGKTVPIIFKPGSDVSGTVFDVSLLKGAFSISLQSDKSTNNVAVGLMIDDVERRLQKLNSKTFAIVPDPQDPKSTVYIEVDENGKQIGSAVYQRASSIPGKKTFLNSEAADRGTLIDAMFRAYIKGEAKSISDLVNVYNSEIQKGKPDGTPYTNNQFTPAFFNDLASIFDGFIRSNPNLVFIADLPTLWGTINGQKFAGSIDLIAIDKVTGKTYIIDLKTSTQNRIDTNGQYYDSYTNSDIIQQSRYGELLTQSTGVLVDGLLIFPIQLGKIKGGGYVSALPNASSTGFVYEINKDPNIFKTRRQTLIVKVNGADFNVTVDNDGQTVLGITYSDGRIVAPNSPLYHEVINAAFPPKPSAPSGPTPNTPSNKPAPLTATALQAMADNTSQNPNAPVNKMFDPADINNAQQANAACKTGTGNTGPSIKQATQKVKITVQRKKN